MDDAISSTTNDKVDGNGTSVADSSTNYDLGLRLVASCITALLSLGLLIFLIHRLRRRKIRGILVFFYILYNVTCAHLDCAHDNH